MRVFVTGSAGFVGAAVVRQLVGDGHEVTALALPGEPVASIETLPGTEVARGDITQPGTLAGLLHGHDAVVHLASLVAYGQRMEPCVRVNVDGTRNLARAAIDAGVRRFVHMSSVAVYGRQAGVELAEDSPMRKIGDPYGDTKIDAECLLRMLAHIGDLDLAVLRPSAMFGPGDRQFLPKLVENVRSGRARIIGDGTNRVDLLHVDDTAKFISHLLGTGAVGTFNLTDPSSPTLAELLEIVAGELGVPTPNRHIGFRVARLLAGAMEATSALTRKPPRLTRYAVSVVGRQYHYDISRALRAGFEPTCTVGDGVRDVVRSIGAPIPSSVPALAQ